MDEKLVEGAIHIVPCAKCSVPTRHKVVTGLRRTDTDPADDIKVWYTYEVIQCQGCSEISFRYNWQSTEDVYYHDDNVPSLVDHTELYPSRLAGRAELRELIYLPYQVCVAYQETHTAFRSGLSVLAGTGIRILVEAVCKDKGAIGSRLVDQINDLVSKQLLTPTDAQFLHRTRLLGNDTAHDIHVPEAATLSAAMDVAEHLLRSAYIMPQVANRLPSLPSP